MTLPSSVPSVSIFDETTTSAAWAAPAAKAESETASASFFSMEYPLVKHR